MKRLITNLCLICVVLAGTTTFAQPINQNLWGTNGSINALVKSGNILYAGGAFTRVAPNIPNGAALSTSTGQPDQTYPKIADGVVHAVLSDGAGGWYVGGDFSKVGGVPRNRIAHILSNQTVDPNFDPDI